MLHGCGHYLNRRWPLTTFALVVHVVQNAAVPGPVSEGMAQSPDSRWDARIESLVLTDMASYARQLYLAPFMCWKPSWGATLCGKLDALHAGLPRLRQYHIAVPRLVSKVSTDIAAVAPASALMMIGFTTRDKMFAMFACGHQQQLALCVYMMDVPIRHSC
jgi:hypothetical protein